MNRTVGLMLATAAIAAGCTKARPSGGSGVEAGSGSAATTTGPGGSGEAGGPAADADAAGPGAPVERHAATGDALAPTLAPAGDAWLVGWEVDDGATRRVVVTTAAGLEAGAAPTTLSEGPAARGLALAGGDPGALAAWLDDGDEPKVRVRRLDAAARPQGAATTLSHGRRPLGPPAAAPLGDGFAVVWVEGAEVHAARLKADGSIAETTSWPGGNRRPYGPINPPPGCEEDWHDDCPAYSDERAEPYPTAPRLHVTPEGLRVRWDGAYWESDDQGMSARYDRALGFPDDGSEPTMRRIDLPVWAHLGDLAADAGGRLAAVQATHDPNGGPWELALRFADAAEAGEPLTSEPAGPLEARLIGVGEQFLVAWPSPTFGGIALRWVGADGAAEPLRALAGAAPQGEAAVTLGARGDAVRVAWVARDGGRAVIRLADPAAAEPARRVDPEVAGTVFLPASRLYLNDFKVARLAAGHRVLLWTQGFSTADSAWSWILDENEAPQGEPVRLSPADAPRCEFTSLAADGDRAVGAFACCAERSMCDASTIYVAELRPGAERKVREIMGPSPAASQPVAVLEGDRVALVYALGRYSRRRVVVQMAELGEGADLLAAIARAEPLEIPAWRGDSVGALAAAFGPEGLVVAFVDSRGQAEDAYRLRTVFVPFSGDPADGVELPSAYHRPVWGEQRMAGTEDGVALVHVRGAAGPGDAELLFLSPSADRVVSRTVLGHGLRPGSPSLARSGGVLAAAFYDAATDGNFATFVETDGRRLHGPVRLDYPALRASTGNPALIPGGEPGVWEGWWTDPSELTRGTVRLTE